MTKDLRNNNNICITHHHMNVLALGATVQNCSFPRTLHNDNHRHPQYQGYLTRRHISQDTHATTRRQDGNSILSARSNGSSVGGHNVTISSIRSDDSMQNKPAGLIAFLNQGDVNINEASLSGIMSERRMASSASMRAMSNSNNENNITQATEDFNAHEDCNNDYTNHIQKRGTVSLHIYSKRGTLDLLQNLNLQDALQKQTARRSSAPSETNIPMEGNPSLLLSQPIEPNMFRILSLEDISYVQDLARQSDLDKDGSDLVPPPSLLPWRRMIPNNDNAAFQVKTPSDCHTAPLVEGITLSESALLYHAISSGASPHVLQSIIDAYPSSAGYQDSSGNTALHCGIERYDTPVDVIQILIKANP
eukprot:15366271-Ditylum_brightwellii.AAC.1